MALLRTARISEAPGFRQLFYNYVTDDPESKIGFEQYVSNYVLFPHILHLDIPDPNS
jgi:hypothetical protein